MILRWLQAQHVMMWLCPPTHPPSLAPSLPLPPSFQTSKELVVLTSALLVVTAILPLVPSYLASFLPDLFDIFIDLATIRQTKRLGKEGIVEGGREEVRQIKGCPVL